MLLPSGLAQYSPMLILDGETLRAQHSECYDSSAQCFGRELALVITALSQESRDLASYPGSATHFLGNSGPFTSPPRTPGSSSE